MRSVRPRRRAFIDLHRITIGDWIVLITSLLTVASLFMPWFISNVPGSHDQWAFTYSEVFCVVVIVFLLATLVLVIYPSLSPDIGARPLPFSTPLVFVTMGCILLLMYMFELGKYSCISCGGIGHGFGIFVGLIASGAYILGAIIRWGSRPNARLSP